MLVNGQIIARPVLTFPLLDHYGIVINAEEGLIADYGSRGKRYVSFAEFMSDKKTYKIYDSDYTKKSSALLRTKFDSLEDRPFSWLHHNCVQFMRHFGRPDLASLEFRKFILIALLAMAIIYFAAN